MESEKLILKPSYTAVFKTVLNSHLSSYNPTIASYFSAIVQFFDIPNCLNKSCETGHSRIMPLSNLNETYPTRDEEKLLIPFKNQSTHLRRIDFESQDKKYSPISKFFIMSNFT